MSLANSLIHLGYVVDAGARVATAMQAIRERYSDDEWDAIEEAHPVIAELVNACTELEDCLEGNGP